MVNENYTHILAIVDRSGSMGWNGIDREMTAALNNFFKEQAKVPGKCLVDYVQFDTQYEKVYEDRHVVDAEAHIHPRYGTALLDAIGRGTVELGRKLRNMKESARPGKVLVVVVTDGAENSSNEYTTELVRQLITQQQDTYNWEYVFLGANMDAVATANLYGIRSESALTFDINNPVAVAATSSSLSGYTTTYRGGGNAAFSDSDRDAAAGK